ncbi:hypothetical protein BAU27_19315 [Bacillus sp. NH11B]|nr:hypothetical protein BAU27_19315 [Bacillus sp. NH11B]
MPSRLLLYSIYWEFLEFSFFIGAILMIIDEPSHPIWDVYIRKRIHMFGSKEEMLSKIVLG